MITILVIAPYQTFADSFAEVSAAWPETSGGMDGYEITTRVIFEYEHAVISAMRPECDVVIARGNTATLLKNGTVPVVEVPVHPYDILHSLQKCRAEYPGRRVYFLATSALSQHIRYLSEYMDLGVELIDLPSAAAKDLESAIAKVDAPNPVIIGGQPLFAFAAKHGIPFLTIESGAKAMRAAYEEACRLAVVRRREMEKLQSFKTVLDYNQDGIIAQDKEHRCISVNAMAAKILGIAAADAVGKRLEDLFPDTPLQQFLAITPHCSDEVVQFNLVPLVVNKAGIFLAGERIGAVVTLQYVSKIQKSEKSIRDKIAERGLVARHTFDAIVGDSPVMRKAIGTAKKYSTVDAGVLLVGQSGTGKELFAQSIHNESPKRNNPFMAINCAALPESLLESELFGYVDGAFTGAVKGGKSGLIELAHGGTLFLDEIGEMPLRLQGRLLRVLQEKEIMRLGSEKITPVSIRVIAATNKDLLLLVRKGIFRDDLYYRLAVLTLRLPALSERREDIPDLARFFLDTFAARLRKPRFAITEEAVACLRSLSWPGNIRELRNTCERLAVLCESGTIEAADIVESEQQLGGFLGFQKRKNVVTQEYVERLLADGHTRQSIADQLGVNRITLWRKMREWNIS